MESNFYFLKEEWPELFQRAQKAEELAITDARTSLTYARMALEVAVNWMYGNDADLIQPYDTSLNSLMKTYEFKNQFRSSMYRDIDLIRKVGNLAIHNKTVSVTDSDKILGNLYYFAKWYAKSYSERDLGDLGLFDPNLVPKEGQVALSKRQLETLQKQLDSELDKYQTGIEEARERNEKLKAENALFQKQIAELQAQIEANKQTASQEDEVQHPRNEKETRLYIIDIILREAGWDLQGANDREYMVKGMPRSTNKSGTGYADYVLWDDDGKPLAVVEAKHTMESSEKGETQAFLYADCLEKQFGQRPVMFYSNGYETHIWDDQFYKTSRQVHGFYTKQELQTLLYRRQHRKDLRSADIDLDITDRSYQMRAIKSVAERFSATDQKTGRLIGTNRGALLVLATGTGKTRVSISLAKVLFENNWAKRILFLADRTGLVRQAKTNFVKHLPEYSSVNLLADKENTHTRLVFSTYQTMMGCIDDYPKDKERFYGVGHFDLVIIDEAHRSIYRKYQAIFEYFDALFLGLTATPKQNDDVSTYESFGLADKTPTDEYTFDEAVANKHLVPYHCISVPTKFMHNGIKYKELSAEEKEQFEQEILNGEAAEGSEWISPAELDRWLFNEDTAIKNLRYVVEHGIRKRGGDELGKTIIFAKSQKHANFLREMFLKLDKTLYGNEYVKVITHSEPKADELIERFCDEEKERLPQIAISVDMMDTGIDAPSVVNLVFYKPVKSYAKFWQMIGRGSRLRPDLFGPGKDKDKFLIFDLCGNFDFFDENPRGIETGIQKSLTEIVFNVKLQIAQYLRESGFQKDETLQQYRTLLLDNLHGEIAGLDTDRFDVKMRLKLVHDYGGDNRELWNHLDDSDISTIEKSLSMLVRPPQGDNDLARSYDLLLYKLMIKRLETPNSEQFINSFAVQINKVARLSKCLLKKTSIPVVKAKEELIKVPLIEDFWKVDGIAHLEKIRSGLRDLMKYIDKDDQKYVTTNFEDEILESKIKTRTAGDVRTDEAPVFTNNVHRLQEIIRKHKDHITISRIRNGEQITAEELAELEHILFSNGFNKSDIEKELGGELKLPLMIVSLTGLDAKHVERSFAEFINENQLSSVQIAFLDTIKKFLTTNGRIDPVKLYDAPFKDYHSMGIDGVFDEGQADRIFEIIDDVNQLAEA